MPLLYLEDLAPGTVIPYGPRSISGEEIVAFARRFDPQPMHIDPEAARQGLFGRLIASGWGTASINMRMIADAVMNRIASMVGPGIEELRWLKPVFPGDTLIGRFHVLETRVSSSKPDRGFAKFRCELDNAAGETVFTQLFTVMVGCRGIDLSAVRPKPPRGPATAPAVPHDAPLPLPFIEDFEMGRSENYGHHTFGEAEIIDFARDYDPQYFHTDVDAAKRSVFGGVIASGWHTGSVMMRLLVEARQRAAQASREANLALPQLGPSPGFRNLRWLKPVYPGDTISYAGTVIEARPLRSRPGWGILRHHNTGTNQLGELVYEMEGAVLWQMRSAV